MCVSVRARPACPCPPKRLVDLTLATQQANNGQCAHLCMYMDAAASVRHVWADAGASSAFTRFYICSSMPEKYENVMWNPRLKCVRHRFHRWCLRVSLTFNGRYENSVCRKFLIATNRNLSDSSNFKHIKLSSMNDWKSFAIMMH